MMLVWQDQYRVGLPRRTRPLLWLDGEAYDMGPWLMFWNGRVGLA